MADYYKENDVTVSVSSVGEALIAMEEEIEKLEDESARLHIRLKAITAKQRVCTSVIQKLLMNSLGGVMPPPCPKDRYPELNTADLGDLIHASQIQNWS